MLYIQASVARSDIIDLHEDRFSPESLKESLTNLRENEIPVHEEFDQNKTI